MTDGPDRTRKSVPEHPPSVRASLSEALFEKTMELSDTDKRVRAARWLGIATHPALITVPIVIAIAYHESGKQSLPVLALAASAFFATFIVPMAFVWVLHREGAIGGDLFFRKQENRSFVYDALSLGMGINAVLLQWVVPFPVGAAMAWTGVLLSALLGIFNRYTKVSFHSASLAALFGLGITLYGKEAFVLAPLLPVVAWARLVSRNHTLFQVILGTLTGLCVSISIVYFGFEYLNKLTAQNVEGFLENPVEYWIPFSGRPK